MVTPAERLRYESAPEDRVVMTEATIAVLALLVFGWAIISGALARHDITGPFVFALAGYVLANKDWGPLTVNVDAASVHIVAEITLALVLFSDAARVNLADLRRDLAIPVRLLGIGLVLSVALGSVLAAWLLGGLPWALAGFVGAALAPTDAALSVQVINDERIPTAHAAGAQRRERAQRRYRHADRGVHAGGGGQPTRHRQRERAHSRRELRCASWAAGSSLGSRSVSAARC